MPDWLYAILCVIVPGVWGVAMYYAFGAWQRRRAHDDAEQGPPPLDYTL